MEAQCGSGGPSVIGSSLTINGRPVTVVGIAPPGFYSERLTDTPPAIWLPIHLLPAIRPIDADLLERGLAQTALRPDRRAA